ncbi:phosphate acetyltransferase [Pseudalkalibacillus salsuginis]|uniref:phosphate acetyltransferase n=1 Tax=Pseudalkalibacillus salsuginis TaxID=2910972 RepID=UPI001F369829|nr:phosphate acetyltransferase [Pseudalkalibacillus salsuginis]MCF6410866.1 phosphate acetyltransferase [Pseudalkalibacillus salsuginis]
MSNMFTVMEQKLRATYPSIVFPEGEDSRIIDAAVRLAEEKILRPILIGDQALIRAILERKGLDLDLVDILSPENYEGFDEMVKQFVERRKGKVNEPEAREILQDVNYFGTMLVYMDKAAGLVSGAAHSTADTVRPALQIIKTKEGIKRTSGAFLMVKEDERYIFADCAININPTATDLAEIAATSADTARVFGLNPRVAMLSFSTKGSAKSDETQKVIDAVTLLDEVGTDFPVDGELQFDAAFVPEVAAKKAPDSPLEGRSNVFVFPGLESGNIGYKMVQRLGGYEAIGPVLQGLNRPVNDLSRGCNSEDVYKLSLITAMQARHK